MAHESEDFLNALLDLSLKDEKPFSHRASWAINEFSSMYPKEIEPHLFRISQDLNKLENHTQIASFLRTFSDLKYDLDDFGGLLDFCLHSIRMPVKSEYLKVMALRIIYTFGKTYPELCPELIEQISQAKSQFEMNYLKKQTIEILKKLQELHNTLT